jgi:YidC/Oxa1 family membrane protein insertase
MDNQRLLLFLALSLVVLLLWEAWSQYDQPVQDAQNLPAQTSTQQAAAPMAPANPADTPSTADAPPSAPVTDTQPQVSAPQSGGSVIQSQQRIRVVTDVLDVDIDTLGGDLRRAYLVKFPITHDEPDKAYPLMGDTLPQLFVAQTGLLANGPAPDHHAIYSAEQTEYVMQAGQDELKVPLTWTSNAGVRVTKVFTFKRNDYLITVDHIVDNNSGADWTGRLYEQFQRNEYDEPGKSRLLYTFTGGAVSTPDKPYEKIEFSEMAEWRPEQSYSKGGWVAMLQHYFVTAWLPGNNDLNHIYTRSINDTRYILGMTGAEQTVPNTESVNFSSQLYVGPKEQKRLEAIDDTLKLTVDYGMLTFIAQPLFWVLRWIHDMIGNWGWSIVLLTLLIKLAFYKLSEASYRSMANMRKLAPKFQSIRERYGDDRQRMSQAMMELYKKEKVNPMSGCWPMLVQIPVFISLYWVLLESVELRQADFMLWINDLSAKDPYYVLPLIMGASMWFQQKLSHNPSLDPMQQKIMQFLPIIFTLFFMLFPAGLVLYWVVNNLLSITQQWYITRKIENASKQQA